MHSCLSAAARVVQNVAVFEGVKNRDLEKRIDRLSQV